MKRIGLLILTVLALPAVLTAGRLSVGIGYPYVSAKYDFKALSAEARMNTGSGINIYAGRGYWNFKRQPTLNLFTGAEAGYIKFNTLSMKGTGTEYSLFAGGEYLVTDNFSLLMDFAPTLIMLRHDVYKDVTVGGMEFVVNMAVYYRFGSSKPKPAGLAAATPPAPEKKAAPVKPPLVKEAEAPPLPGPAAAPAPDKAEVAALVAKLDSIDWKERRKAAFELGKIKATAAVKPLIQLLDDENDKVRGVAAMALGHIGDPKALAPLIVALEDDASMYVRASAAKGLSYLKDKRALKSLEAASKSPAQEVRLSAEEAIEKITGTFGKIGSGVHLAVTEFVGKDVSQSEAAIVAGFLRVELAKSGLYTVMDGSEMNDELADRHYKPKNGCEDQKCAVQMGRSLKVKQILVGSLAKLPDGSYYITVNLVDVGMGKTMASYNSTARAAKDIIPATRRIVIKLSQ